ncbi:aconitate hydratase AcnA [Kiloniella laminariae]|uniref:Aconitate hydratase n=1 Tax=Kiloniella laminariae TaxID=454162 RepID=A0ABT4LK18_9PROT|nr:aconitate hydratase AcnA [Kiloniella laminariae]MCZ4281443.1 aconitate hydratase AcnA [Kiloniella laminariae]
MALGKDTLKTRRQLKVNGKAYDYYSLEEASKTLGDISRLPFSLKVLLENLLRFEDNRSVTVDDIKAMGSWLKDCRSDREIAYRPARVLMQDFTGVPAVVDLAAMRQAMVDMGGDPKKINPLSPVDLVIDHSVMVDSYGGPGSFQKNVDLEFERNGERYAFLRWGQKAFDNFRVVPPGTGICHQVNVENLAQVVWTKEEEGVTIAYPDTLVGTDSHTTMVNGLSVLGWGVGGIEAEAAMLGQPVSMVIPEVVGMKMTGEMKEGTTATDLVLTITEILRAHGVVGKFVEFYGSGLDNLTLADQATIANMAPEYGATCGFFPVDAETIRYLRFTGRDEDRVALVEAYAKAQGMWRETNTPDPVFTASLELDLSTVEPSLAGPKRPQDRISLSNLASKSIATIKEAVGEDITKTAAVAGKDYGLNHGDVMIAAITSCTNTSNPSVLIGAGLVAKKAYELGLTVKPWVKTSLAPGSQVVTDYLEKAGLQDYLNKLGFDLVGYGCTTCIGNSGPLADEYIDAIDKEGLQVAAVLSGNRNFEGRVSPQTRLNYLASPPLVVAYALAGNVTLDLLNDPIGQDKAGKDVYLKDIWPSSQEIAEVSGYALTPEMFKDRYSNVFEGPEEWKKIETATGLTYDWNDQSTYVQYPPFFEGMSREAGGFSDVTGARPLLVLADNITTDHISPAGSIKADSPGGSYLTEHQVRPVDFNSYGSRRGNHHVMMRGTFANIRIKNEMVDGIEGGFSKYKGETMPVYDAAMKYMADETPLVVFGGKEYGMGSSRDWAAKGTRLLGIKAVIVESFERIHRSNLVGMGVLPLQFKDGMTRQSLKITGDETIDLSGIADGIKPGMDVECRISRPDGSVENIKLLCRIDTADEVEYYRHGGILHYVLRNLMNDAA